MFTQYEKIDAVRSASCSNIETMVALVEEFTVVGFYQGCDLWVVHPSAKQNLFWQATHYDTQKKSMLDDCLGEDIKSLLGCTELNLNEPVLVMHPEELEKNLVDASSDLYRAT